MPLLPPPRVVITGIGMVTPLGRDRETTWEGLKQGQGGLHWLRCLDDAILSDLTSGDAGLSDCGFTASRSGIAGGPSVRFAGGSVPDNASAGWPTRTPGAPELFADPVVTFAERAAAEAVLDSGLELARENRDRVGCVVGTSKGGLRSFSAAWEQWLRPQVASHACQGSHAWQQFFPHAAAGAIAATYDLRGAALCPVAACATGLACIARGADLIQTGYCDVVLAGSSDASLQAIVLASFQRLGVLARSFDDPAAACRPFDRRRNGFLVGEGAAILVLESEAHADTRGARPYAEWLAAGSVADTANLTSLSADALSLTRLITDVLREAGLAPDELDYVNLHGTATRQNDLCETRALKNALGRAARRVPCSTVKGAIGHLLGAAGSVELAATLLALRDGVIPPTLNLHEPDAECDLDYTPLVSRTGNFQTALKLSLGFGGQLVAAAVQKADRSR